MSSWKRDTYERRTGKPKKTLTIRNVEPRRSTNGERRKIQRNNITSRNAPATPPTSCTRNANSCSAPVFQLRHESVVSRPMNVRK